MKLKHAIGVFVIGIIGCSGVVRAEIPSFPGAEGFGATAVGGRGGDVYIVKNLDASGPGSFAEGITTAPTTGRTIVFAVSGYIPINKMHLKASNITIAGQTAPGDGVGLKGSSIRISGDNTVIQHMRFRHGRNGNGGDCVNPDNGAKHIIFDHCDAMFSTDENFSMFREAPAQLTFQWSINAWGLQTHSAGGLWLIDHATVHHTLWANNHTRNPKVIRPILFDWINNIVFAWDIGFNLAGADVTGRYKVNMLGSYFIHGGKSGPPIYGGGYAPDGAIPFHLYMNDCALDGNGDGKFNTTATDLELVAPNVIYNKSQQRFPQTSKADPKFSNDPILGVPVTVEDRDLAYKKIISQVGPLRMDIDPSKPLRDEVDSLLISDLVAQKRRIIASEAELGLSNNGFGTLKSDPAPLDTDQDGMPDDYEQALGWDAAKQDHNTPLPGNSGLIAGTTFLPEKTVLGYTRLEEYLYFLTIPHGKITQNKVGESHGLKIDLHKFTSGFVNSPKFTIQNVIGGTVKQNGNEGKVEFIPTAGFVGRARFDFVVTEDNAQSWAQTCAIVVTP